MRVLLICDDAKERPVLSYALQQVGVETITAQEVEEALVLWEKRPAELILLLQHDKPLVAVRRLRAATIVPLLLITDELPEYQKIKLMEEGKAMLVTRPYSLRLLMSQIPLLLKQADGIPRTTLDVQRQGQVRLDPRERTVKVGVSEPQKLSKLEFNLLLVLMWHTGQVLPTETLIVRVWGYNEGDKALLQKLIYRLRKKIEPFPKQPRYLLTVGEEGYTFKGD